MLKNISLAQQNRPQDAIQIYRTELLDALKLLMASVHSYGAEALWPLVHVVQQSIDAVVSSLPEHLSQHEGDIIDCASSCAHDGADWKRALCAFYGAHFVLSRSSAVKEHENAARDMGATCQGEGVANMAIDIIRRTHHVHAKTVAALALCKLVAAHEELW